MPTINGKACIVDGTPVDKVFSNGRQVYGANLFTGTSNADGSPKVYNMSPYPWAATSFQDMAGDLKSSFTRNGQGILLHTGDQYVLSFDYTITKYDALKAAGVNTGFSLGTGTYIGYYSADTFRPNSVSTIWKYSNAQGHISYNLEVKSNGDGLYLAIRPIRTEPGSIDTKSLGVSISITRLKLETGNVETDWSPAPEDVM